MSSETKDSKAAPEKNIPFRGKNGPKEFHPMRTIRLVVYTAFSEVIRIPLVVPGRANLKQVNRAIDDQTGCSSYDFEKFTYKQKSDNTSTAILSNFEFTNESRLSDDVEEIICSVAPYVIPLVYLGTEYKVVSNTFTTLRQLGCQLIEDLKLKGERYDVRIGSHIRVDQETLAWTVYDVLADDVQLHLIQL